MIKLRCKRILLSKLETRSKENIEEKNDKIKILQVEVDTHMEHNELTDANIMNL